MVPAWLVSLWWERLFFMPFQIRALHPWWLELPVVAMLLRAALLVKLRRLRSLLRPSTGAV